MYKATHGGDIYSKPCRIDFSANMNPLGMPPAVYEAACRGVRESVNYPDILCRDLVRRLGKVEEIDPDQIVCGNGAADLIFSLTRALKPKKALLVAPGFAEYEQALQAGGCQEMLFYTCLEEKGFHMQPDYTDLLQEEIDMVFLCNPSNPTGITIDPEILQATADLCEKHDIWLVVDECFNPFLEDSKGSSLKHLLKTHPHLIILKAFTKLYAMAGLRLGYVLTENPELPVRLRSVMQPWSVSLPAMRAGEAALEEEDYVRETMALIRAERTWLRGELQKLGLKVYDSRANYLFFRGPEGLSQACEAQGILIRDCSNYRGLEQGYYRVSVRTREENEVLIGTLQAVLSIRA
ncbi:MAG: pyridoxal phosphate-dependent class II aminotransferase [Lachnospiraceae bacterium]|nr:pyridoxal phosphate-dependent class II aminotransferase [Lachnospiraceae bacterium]